MIILGSLKKSWELNSGWRNLNICFTYIPQAKSAKLGWVGKKKKGEGLCKNIKTESKLASIWRIDVQQVLKAR